MHAALLLTLALAGYFLWIDQRVGESFARWRWELPARVYARPLELYARLEIGRAEFEAELQRLGYRAVANPAGPGQFTVRRDRIDVHTRGFTFWDTREPSQVIRVRFSGGQVAALEKPSAQQPLPLVRLEPMEIARIHPRHPEDRVLVRYADVPAALIDALIAVEDRRFYAHRGVDLLAIARAAWANIRERQIRQGGSTLTQQLVKNFYLGRERTFWRKANELLMALSLERRYTKAQILEAYLNEIYLGQDGERAIHGFGLAAEFYFGRPLGELRLHELALLAGLAKGASYYDPRRHPERAVARRNLVLAAMVETSKLAEPVAAEARGAPLSVSRQPLFRSMRYPAFVDLVRRQLQRDYLEEDLRTEGLQIFTSLDPRLQSLAEEGVMRQLAALEKSYRRLQGRLQAAMVVTNPQNGEVLAMVGDRNPRFAGFNRVLDARRPVGSLLKPAVFLTALQHPGRYTVATILQDEPITLQSGGKSWTPSNYDKIPHGPVMLEDALAQSYNLATVQLGLSIGIPAVHGTLHRLGIERELPAYPSLFLGAVDLSPLEVMQMYQTIAAKGFRTSPRAIRDVLTRDGQRLRRYDLTTQAAADPEAIYLLTHLMTKVTRVGTGAGLVNWLGPKRTVAGKTGTTDDLRDSWFAGFSEDLTAVVWVGRDDNAPIYLTGAQGAMRVWGDFMASADAGTLRMDAPPGIAWRWFDPLSGAFTPANCPGARPLPFMQPAPPPPIGSCRVAPSSITERLDARPY
ncbi:MAG: penicillin-binding protein 1B [Chromatiales bacterium]